MTARQLADSPGVRLAVYALAIGIAWATLKAEVNQKADKTEVQEIRAVVLDIKTILCSQPSNAGDSACKQR